MGNHLNPGSSRLRWAKWSIILACWLLVGLFFGSRQYLNALYRGSNISWWNGFWGGFASFLIWAALTPSVLYLSERFPLQRLNWQRNISIHISASVVYALLYFGISGLISLLIWGQPAGPNASMARIKKILITEAQTEVLTYWAITVVGQAINFYRKYQRQELLASQLQLKTSKLEASLTQAQLDALRMQLHPHFLFNTLNSISGLMLEDVDTANRMLIGLSDLLRISLENIGTNEVTLKQELEYLKIYLEIEHTRFQDRLTVSIDIGPDTLEAQVPNLILQPLVENAIRHGVMRRVSPGVINVCARRLNGMLELRVRDDGPGPALSQISKGIGLSNTEERLTQLYGSNHRFELRPADGSGLEVAITIPYRTEQ